MFDLLDDEGVLWCKRIKSRYLFTSPIVRIGTRILDFTILYTILLPFVLIEKMIYTQIENNGLTDFTAYYEFTKMNTIIFTILVVAFELAIPLITRGRTLGKMITKQRVISNSGDYASRKQIVARGLFYLSLLLITQANSFVGRVLPISNRFVSDFLIRLMKLNVFQFIENGLNILVFISILTLIFTKYSRTIYGYCTRTCVVNDEYYHKRRNQIIQKGSEN